MKTITKYWFLEGFNIFKKLGTLNMMKISEIFEMDTVEKGKSLTLSSEKESNVFFLKRGTIKVLDASNKTVKHVIKRGEIFGELSLYDEQSVSEEVVYALEECVICYIESEQMKLLMDKHNSLKNEVFKIYGFRIKKLEQRLEDLLYKSCSVRISEFISKYIEEFSEKEEDGRLVAKNLLSHKDIANLTNTSRQSVSNQLSLMRKKGIIDYNAQFISMPKQLK